MTQDGLEPAAGQVNAAMGVAVRGRDATGVTYTQPLGLRLHDHRGVVPLGAVGVLLDSAVAGAVYDALPPGGHSLASSLAVSAARDLPLHGVVSVTGRLLNFDDEIGVGLGAGEVVDSEGRVCATAIARAVTVTRKVDRAAMANLAVRPAEPDTAATDGNGAEQDSRYGLDVVRGIANGDIDRGPFADLLSMELRVVDTGLVTAALTPQVWMSNEMGTVQGGVLFAAADLLSGLAAQTVTEPGEHYRVLDLRIDFVRSPSLTGADIKIESEVVRAGRRIELVESRLTGSDGRLMARAFATVHRK